MNLGFGQSQVWGYPKYGAEDFISEYFEGISMKWCILGRRWDDEVNWWNHKQLYAALNLIDPFELADFPPSSFHHLVFSPDPDTPLLLTIVDRPELTPILPPLGGLPIRPCSPPSSPAPLRRFRFFVEACSCPGLMPFSHILRCSRYTAIVARASVT